jgi:uncharacterized protein YjbI with pentapeptide repeats
MSYSRCTARWVETNGAEGMRLNLSSADLRRVCLAGAIMDEANIASARLWRANLNPSDQRGSFNTGIMQGPLPQRWREISRRTLSDVKLNVRRLIP